MGRSVHVGGRRGVLTHSIPVSRNTYSGVSQSVSVNKPIVFVADTHTKAERRRRCGSRRNTFMTTPVVRKSVTWEKTGATFEVSPVGPSVNVSRMRINSMIRSSVYLFTVRPRDPLE